MSSTASQITFGRLQDLAPREAWAHEAHAFTPWLAENIDHLSEAIGIPLEITGQEVRVETFAADILARNPQDGSVVLIENQLEATDHTHLGQIMTYLAGLEAKTVVWIAPSFREPHLSAIRWLNEHTADGFSFFAVKLRVVRIGDSPFAPIFEIIEKPNDWERQVAETRRQSASPDNPLSLQRQKFWREYIRRYPEVQTAGLGGTKLSYGWLALVPEKLAFVPWIGRSESGFFVRSWTGSNEPEAAQMLEPHAAVLSERLGIPFKGPKVQYLNDTMPIALADEERWPELIEWMERRRQEYTCVISDVLQEAE